MEKEEEKEAKVENDASVDNFFEVSLLKLLNEDYSQVLLYTEEGKMKSKNPRKQQDSSLIQTAFHAIPIFVLYSRSLRRFCLQY